VIESVRADLGDQSIRLSLEGCGGRKKHDASEGENSAERRQSSEHADPSRTKVWCVGPEGPVQPIGSLEIVATKGLSVNANIDPISSISDSTAIEKSGILTKPSVQA
jgi:hypothetical protein